MRSLFTSAFCIIFVFIGAILLFFGVRSLKMASASTNWPVTPGKIVNSSVVTGHSGNNGGITYRAEVLYKYAINGENEMSNRVSFGNYGSSDPSHAEGIVNKYPAGSEVTVHYSPSDPTKSVLETGVSGGTYMLPGIGAAFMIAGIVMLLLFAFGRRYLLARGRTSAF